MCFFLSFILAVFLDFFSSPKPEPFFSELAPKPIQSINRNVRVPCDVVCPQTVNNGPTKNTQNSDPSMFFFISLFENLEYLGFLAALSE